MNENRFIKSAPKGLRLILASQSPRRREILSWLGIPFETADQDFEETLAPDLTPRAQAARLAEAKVRAYLKAHTDCRDLVLGGDTLLDLAGEPLGKPQDRDQARDHLRRLSGRTHEVVTALSLFAPGGTRSDTPGTIDTRWEVTKVRFHRLDETLIEYYLSLGEWRDAAGAYKIQRAGDLLVKKVSGSFSNVVGLPIRLFYVMLAGYMPLSGGQSSGPSGVRVIEKGHTEV